MQSFIRTIINSIRSWTKKEIKPMFCKLENSISQTTSTLSKRIDGVDNTANMAKIIADNAQTIADDAANIAVNANNSRVIQITTEPHPSSDVYISSVNSYDVINHLKYGRLVYIDIDGSIYHPINYSGNEVFFIKFVFLNNMIKFDTLQLRGNTLYPGNVSGYLK